MNSPPTYRAKIERTAECVARADAAADAISGFEYEHPVPHLLQLPRGSQTSSAGAYDDDPLSLQVCSWEAEERRRRKSI
jgi:hypothetical protein